MSLAKKAAQLYDQLYTPGQNTEFKYGLRKRDPREVANMEMDRNVNKWSYESDPKLKTQLWQKGLNKTQTQRLD